MSNLLDFSGAPDDPYERLLWLSGVQPAVDAALEREWRECYFQLRLEGRLPEVLDKGWHSRTKVLRWTRNENQRRGRAVRWADGLDSTSTAYSG